LDYAATSRSGCPSNRRLLQDCFKMVDVRRNNISRAAVGLKPSGQAGLTRGSKSRARQCIHRLKCRERARECERMADSLPSGVKFWHYLCGLPTELDFRHGPRGYLAQDAPKHSTRVRSDISAEAETSVGKAFESSVSGTCVHALPWGHDDARSRSFSYNPGC
jgi:hypothetical protein